MKKLSLLFCAFALIGFVMVGCNDDDDPTVNQSPSISDWSVNGMTMDMTSGSHSPSDSIVFTFLASDNEGLKNLMITEDVSGSSGTTTLKDEALNGGSSTISYIYIVDSSATDGATITLTFTITDDGSLAEKDLADETTSKTYVITVEVVASTTDLSAEQDFEFKRVGGTAGTGLSTFGLAWTSNTASAAIVKRDSAIKLVVLAASDYTSITTQEALKAKVDSATAVDDYQGVSSSSSGTYDDVIATINGSTYYMLHVTTGTVSTDSLGTTISIVGKYKN